MMLRYRKQADAGEAPVVSIDPVSAGEVNPLDNVRPDVAFPDEVIERVAATAERAQQAPPPALRTRTQTLAHPEAGLARPRRIPALIAEGPQAPPSRPTPISHPRSEWQASGISHEVPPQRY